MDHISHQPLLKIKRSWKSCVKFKRFAVFYHKESLLFHLNNSLIRLPYTVAKVSCMQSSDIKNSTLTCCILRCREIIFYCIQEKNVKYVQQHKAQQELINSQSLRLHSLEDLLQLRYMSLLYV